MNIQPKDFLERIEISEKKNNKIALIGLTLGAISVLLTLNKGKIVAIGIIYGVLIIAISIYSLSTDIQEKRFYKKINYPLKNKNKLMGNIFIDITLLLFGMSLLIYILIISFL